jgi:hypothetical protein
MEGPKHNLRVWIKWVIRVVGVGFLYNSPSSPFVGLVLVALSLTLYIPRAILKHFFSRKQIKLKKKAM